MSHDCCSAVGEERCHPVGTLKWQKMANTTVRLSGAIPDGGRPPAVARSRPKAADAPPGPLDDAASAPLRRPLTAHATKRLYQRRYNYDWPRLPFPFLFGR